jgi:hypothetical protein
VLSRGLSRLSGALSRLSGDTLRIPGAYEGLRGLSGDFKDSLRPSGTLRGAPGAYKGYIEPLGGGPGSSRGSWGGFGWFGGSGGGPPARAGFGRLGRSARAGWLGPARACAGWPGLREASGGQSRFARGFGEAASARDRSVARSIARWLGGGSGRLSGLARGSGRIIATRTRLRQGRAWPPDRNCDRNCGGRRAGAREAPGGFARWGQGCARPGTALETWAEVRPGSEAWK